MDIKAMTLQYDAVVERINQYPMFAAGRAAILAGVREGYLEEVQAICQRDSAAVDISSLPQLDLDPVRL